jgi:hypothetical protein
LNPADKHRLINICKRDAEFFEKHEIIDYSLLIGVIRKSDNLSDQSDARQDSRMLRE